MEDAVTQLVTYTAAVHTTYPNIKIGEILPYAYAGFDKEEVLRVLNLFKAKSGGEMQIAEFEPYFQTVADYENLKQLIDTMRARGIETGILLHGLKHPLTNPTTDQEWQNNVLEVFHQCNKYHITPDHFLLTSWIQVPGRAEPETQPYTFTNTALKLLDQNRDTPPRITQ